MQGYYESYFNLSNSFLCFPSYIHDRIWETKGWKLSSKLSNLLLINTQFSKEIIQKKKIISCFLGLCASKTSMIPAWEIGRDGHRGREVFFFLSSNTLEIKINRQSVSKKQMLCWKALQAELHQLAFSGEAGLQRLAE